MSERGRPNPEEEPAPGSPEERAADLHALKVFLIWFACCAGLAALWLAFSIWIDWRK